ncbi:prefoldin subunit 1-like [Amphiura filiformis]|uniref:prefoldin subunit 1-like n=1 Tax=Amphiura filiformis TaxID=82378 RepID=UPI003B227AAC
MAGPDMELKKAFEELHIKMVETSQQLRVNDLQIDQLKRQQQHAKLTGMEIKGLPEGTNVYEGIGRMFLLQDLAAISQLLDDKVKTADDKVTKLQSNKVYLDQKLKESEGNLREMVAQKQASKS